MSKQSGFLQRMEAEKRRACLEAQRFTRQLMVDISMIALNSEFGFGADRLKRYADRLKVIFEEYADLWNGDTADTEYSRAKLDAKLRQICGDQFVEWEERYS